MSPGRRVGGDLLWTVDTDNAVMSSPTVVDGTVYVGSNDSNLYALDAETGDREWAFQTGAMVESSPTVVDGTVYVGSNDSNLYALDARTGKQGWTLQTDGKVESSPTVAGNTVYVGSSDSTVYAVNVETGEQTYSFETDGSIESSPAVVDGTVYIGSNDAKLHAIDAETSEQEWVFETRLPVRSSPTVVDDTVFVGSRDNHLYAVDAATGEQRWQFKAGWRLHSSPTVRDGTVYIGSIDNHLYAIDATRGTQQWTLDTGFPVHSSPTVADGTVYIGSNDSNLHAVDAETGTQQWTFQTESAVRCSPTVVDGTVYVGCCNGTLYAIATGATGQRSEDSRVMLGTLGHHDAWTSRLSAPTFGDSASETTAGPDLRTGHASSPSEERIQTADHPPATPSQSLKGSLSYNAIENEELIGTGGNADVYRAIMQDSGMEWAVAVKEPRMSGTLHTEVVERMMEEAETWQQLDDHDHIVSVLDYDAEPLPWIAMEYMDGGHLGERAGRLPFDQAVWTAIAVTKGVRHAHRRGVAHLDLKPENVLFWTTEGGWDVPKVADWGLSKHLLKHSKSIEGLSPHYAAPEQFDDSYGSADDLTDVYQLGAVFYELFTGRPPFEGQPAMVMNKVLNEWPDPPSSVADVPPELDDVLQPALAKQKEERYDSVLYLRDELQGLREEETGGF